MFGRLKRKRSWVDDLDANALHPFERAVIQCMTGHSRPNFTSLVLDARLGDLLRWRHVPSIHSTELFERREESPHEISVHFLGGLGTVRDARPVAEKTAQFRVHLTGHEPITVDVRGRVASMTLFPCGPAGYPDKRTLKECVLLTEFEDERPFWQSHVRMFPDLAPIGNRILEELEAFRLDWAAVIPRRPSQPVQEIAGFRVAAELDRMLRFSDGITIGERELHCRHDLELYWKRGSFRAWGHHYQVIGSDPNGQYSLRVTGNTCEEPVYRTSVPKPKRVAPSVTEWCLAQVRRTRCRR